MAEIDSGHFTTSDGVELHFLEAGTGPTLVLLPGWSQSAALFHHQLEDLSDSFRCLALDYRGHGESAKPNYGYRVSRLAMDVREFLETQDLHDVILLGHSAGCAVIWNYIDLFGEENLRGLVVCDQMIAGIKRPEWSESECRNYGALINADVALTNAAAIGGPDGETVSRKFITSMFTSRFPDEKLENVIEENLKFPRSYAAQLMLSVINADFRDLLPRITLPTLCIGGKGSHLGPDVMPWIASQIPGGQVMMIDADASGSHFVFLENPNAFNVAVQQFCSSL